MGYRQLLRLNPRNPLYHNNYAYALYERSRGARDRHKSLEEALHHHATAVSLEPLNFQYRMQYTDALHHANKYGQAQQQFELLLDKYQEVSHQQRLVLIRSYADHLMHTAAFTEAIEYQKLSLDLQKEH